MSPFTRYVSIDISAEVEKYGHPIAVVANGSGGSGTSAYIYWNGDTIYEIRISTNSSSGTYRVSYCKNTVAYYI